MVVWGWGMRLWGGGVGLGTAKEGLEETLE